MPEWEIYGVSRETGQREQVWERDTDYSNISDTMLNDGDKSREYEKMELYENGRLIETAHLTMPGGGGWIISLLVLAVVLLIMCMH